MITYNHSSFIEQAIEGVLKQDVFEGLELIIGDDCSTDNTAFIVKKFVAKYPDNIKLIERSTNVGMINNFIDTLRQCNGKYIALCEGDDFWTDESKLSKQLEILSTKENVDIVFTDSKVFNNSKNQIFQSWASISKNYFNINDLLKGNFITTCTVLFRNKLNQELLESLRSFNIGDWPLYLLLLNHTGGSVFYLSDSTAIYREHGQGMYTSASTQNRMKYVVGVYEELLNMKSFKKHSHVIRFKLSSTLYCLGRFAESPQISYTHYKESIKYFNFYNLKYPFFSAIRIVQNTLRYSNRFSSNL